MAAVAPEAPLTAAAVAPASTAAAVAPAAADVSAAGPPPTKKQRVLKMMNSEDTSVAPTEELEAATLEHFVKKIRRCFEERKLYSEDPSSPSNMHFWVRQVVGALRSSESKGIQQGESKGNSLLRKQFLVFLFRELCKVPCFSVLKHIVPLCKDLVKYGCETPCRIETLERFANLPVDQPSADLTLDFGEDNLEARYKFYDSTLYKDFVETRAAALLTAAHGARTREAREAALRSMAYACAGIDGKSSSVQKKSAWAKAMMSAKVPKEARLRFAFEADAPERVAFANGFAILDDDDVDWQALAGCVEPKAEAMGSDPTPTQGPSQPIQFYQQKMVFFCIDIVGKLGWVGRGLEWSPSQPIQFHHYVDAKKYIFCG